MSIQIRRIAPGGDVKVFLEVAHNVYRGDPNWVAPLDLEMKDRLNPKSNPFWEHADGMYFVAEQDGRAVGRATAQIDHEHQKRYADAVGFIGFVDTIDDPMVSQALLDAACAWLRERGMKTARGPVSLSVNEEMGMLVEGFDTPPMIMMPHHRPYQGALMERAGFAKAKDLFAWSYDVTAPVPARAQKALDDMNNDPTVRVRTVDLKHAERDVRIVMDIFNDAWHDNWGFVPLTESELAKTAKDFKLIVEPDIALIAEVNGEPAAISIAMPNLNEVIRDLGGKLLPFGFAKVLWRMKVKKPSSGRLILLGIRKKFRTQRQYAGLSIALYTEMSRRGRLIGLKRGELGWTLEDNAAINVGIKLMGGKVYKRYRVYEKAL